MDIRLIKREERRFIPLNLKYVANSRNPEKIKKTALNIFSNRSITREKCIESIKDYSIEKVMERIIKIHQDLAQKKK